MREYRQASWDEPLLFELGEERPSIGLTPTVDAELSSYLIEVTRKLEGMVRKEINLPNLSEITVLRHFTRLSQMNYSVSTGMYPLGSCTMKYNPPANELVANDPKLTQVHPLQDPETVQGSLEILYRLERMLCAITGMDRFSFVTSAGAHAEFAACLIMRKYYLEKGEKRDVMLIPDSAHGTNPASAAMAGFKVEVIETDRDGCVDLKGLKEAMGEDVAGMMLTNPNTLGLFESRIKEVVDIVHGGGGTLYYDGANLNAILGISRPGDMGFDILHLNLHKTFSTPHGGGGPGAGPIGVKKHLVKYLPPPLISYSPEKGYYVEVPEKTIGYVRTFYGNFLVCVRAYAYLLRLGWKGLRETAEVATLTSNYLMHKISSLRGISLPYGRDRPRKHEFVVSLSRLLKETGVSARDVAKRMIDYGVHPPTTYFPLIVDEAFMIEPTETEPKREIDRYAEVMKKVIEEAYEDRGKLIGAPTSSAVRRINEVKANHPRHIKLSWRMHRRGYELEAGRSADQFT